MVPGMTERAARAAELQRRSCLDDAERWHEGEAAGTSVRQRAAEAPSAAPRALLAWGRTTARRAWATLAVAVTRPARRSTRRHHVEPTTPTVGNGNALPTENFATEGQR